MQGLGDGQLWAGGTGGDGKGSRSTPSLQGHPVGRQMNRELQMRGRFGEENSKPLFHTCLQQLRDAAGDK